MKCAIYARVSTTGGRQDLENQLAPLREWAGRLGAEVIVEHVDECSGSKGSKDRKALALLLQGAHRRQFDTVLVWALDRLSREGIAKLSGYLEALRRSGVRVLSHQEPWLDTSGPVSDLLIAIFGWVAQQERARIRERILAGLERAKGKGKILGRPELSFDIEIAKRMKQEGKSLRTIAKALMVSKSTLSRTLSKADGQMVA